MTERPLTFEEFLALKQQQMAGYAPGTQGTVGQAPPPPPAPAPSPPPAPVPSEVYGGPAPTPVQPSSTAPNAIQVSSPASGAEPFAVYTAPTPQPQALSGDYQIRGQEYTGNQNAYFGKTPDQANAVYQENVPSFVVPFAQATYTDQQRKAQQASDPVHMAALDAETQRLQAATPGLSQAEATKQAEQSLQSQQSQASLTDALGSSAVGQSFPGQLVGGLVGALGAAKDALPTTGPIGAIGTGLSTAGEAAIKAASIPSQRLDEVTITRKYDELTKGNPDATFGAYLPSTILESTVITPAEHLAEEAVKGSPRQYEAMQTWLDDPTNAGLIQQLFEQGYGGEQGYAAVKTYFDEQAGLGAIAHGVIRDPFTYAGLGVGAMKSTGARLAAQGGKIGTAGKVIGGVAEIADAAVLDPLKAPGLVVRGVDAAVPGIRLGERLATGKSAVSNAVLTEAGRRGKTLNQAEESAANLVRAAEPTSIPNAWTLERDATGNVVHITDPFGNMRPVVRDLDTGVTRVVDPGDVERAMQIASRLPNGPAYQQHMDDWLGLITNNRRTYGLPEEISTLYPSRGAPYQRFAVMEAERMKRYGQEVIDASYERMNNLAQGKSGLAKDPVKAALLADRIQSSMEIAGVTDLNAQVRKKQISRIRTEARATGNYRKTSTYNARIASGAKTPPGGTPTRLTFRDTIDVLDDDTRAFGETVLADRRVVGDVVMDINQDAQRLQTLAKQAQSGTPLSAWDQSQLDQLLKKYGQAFPRAVSDIQNTMDTLAKWSDEQRQAFVSNEATRQIAIDKGWANAKTGTLNPTGIAASKGPLGKLVRGLDSASAGYKKVQLYNPLNILRYSGLQAIGNAVTIAVGDLGALEDYAKAIGSRGKHVIQGLKDGGPKGITSRMEQMESPADAMMRGAGLGRSPFLKSGLKDDLSKADFGNGPVTSVLKAGRNFAGAFDISLREAAYMHRFQPKYRALQMGIADKAVETARRMGVPVSPDRIEQAIRGLDGLNQANRSWDAAQLKSALIQASRDVGGVRPLVDTGTGKAMTLGDSQLAQQARARLDKMGLKDVALKVEDRLTVGERDIAGSYTPADRLIQISRRITEDDRFRARPDLHIERVVDHEAVHAMRELGLFTDEEWRSLVDEAGKQLSPARTKGGYTPPETFAKRAERDNLKTYGNLGVPGHQDLYDQEAVAELFAHWRLGGSVSPIARTTLQKMYDFLVNLVDLVRGTDAEKVMRRMSSGEIGQRARYSGQIPGIADEAEKVRTLTTATGSRRDMVENWADRVSRDYANGVRTLHKDAISNVNRLGFAFDEVKGEQALGRIFFYTQWTTRANMLYTREMLGNPALLNAYVNTWKTLDRQCETDHCPSWQRGMIQFFQSPMGLTVLANPLAVANAMGIFNPDILAPDWDNSNLTDLGKGRQRSPFMINPFVDTLLLAVGAYGSGAQPSNLMPISFTKLYDWINEWNAHTDNPISVDKDGNPVPLPWPLRFGVVGQEVPKILAEKLSPLTAPLLNQMKVPADVMQFGDAAAGQRQDITFLMLDVLAEQNPTLSQEQLNDLLVDEHAGGFDTGDPIYQQALDRYTERAYAGILEGKDVPNAVRALISAAEPFQRSVNVTARTENDATINSYFQSKEDAGTYQNILAAQIDEPLRVGGFDVAPPSLFTEVHIGGSVVTPEDLAGMSDRERQEVADAWFGQRNPGVDPNNIGTFPEAAYRSSQIAKAADPKDLALQEAENRWSSAGTPEQNDIYHTVNAIKYNDTMPDGSAPSVTVTIDGQPQTFDAADLNKMTQEERNDLSALWVAEQPGGQAALDGYYAAREQLVTDDPDLGGWKAMQDLAGGYPGGGLAWVQEAIKENPSTYGQYAATLDPTRYPEGSPDWVTEMLSLEAYQSLNQERPSSKSPLAWPDTPGAPVIPGLSGAASLPELYTQQQTADAADRETFKNRGDYASEDLTRMGEVKTYVDQWDTDNGQAAGTTWGLIMSQMTQGYQKGVNGIDYDLKKTLDELYPRTGPNGEVWSAIPGPTSSTGKYVVWALRQPPDQRDPQIWARQSLLKEEFDKAATQGVSEDATGAVTLNPEPAALPAEDILSGYGLVRAVDGSGESLSTVAPAQQAQTPQSWKVGGLGGTLYADASTNSQSLLALRPDTPLTTLGEQGDWINVQHPSGLTGWVRKRFLATDAPTSTAPPVSSPTTTTPVQTPPTGDVISTTSKRGEAQTPAPVAGDVVAAPGSIRNQVAPPQATAPPSPSSVPVLSGIGDALGAVGGFFGGLINPSTASGAPSAPASVPEPTTTPAPLPPSVKQAVPTATPTATLAPQGSRPGKAVTPDVTGQQIANLADDYSGVAYVHEFPTKDDDPYRTGWDCSSFVHWVADNLGISEVQQPNGPGYVGGGVPVGSHFQYQWAVANDRIIGTDPSQAQPGDIIFFSTDPTRQWCDPANYNGCMNNDASHVGIYLGLGQNGNPAMINAEAPGIGTVFEDLTQYPYPILGIARIT